MVAEGSRSGPQRLASIVAVCSLLGARSVRAAEPSASEATVPAAEAATDDRKRADDLYREGVSLLEAKNYPDAEAKFQASYALLKGRGTLLNLAICHENLGKLASAWRELKTVYEEALLADDTVRQDAASEHLAWLEPQLSYANVTLSDDAKRAGVRVELDGAPLFVLGTLFPIDPGRHQLRASAPNKKVWAVEVLVESGSPPQSILVPALADEVAAAPVVPLDATPAAPKRLPEPTPQPDFAPAYVAGTVTGALTLGAVASAFLYYDRRSNYYESVTEQMSDSEQHSRRGSAERMAWINGTLVVGAGVGAAVTGLLWYRARQQKATPPAQGAWVAPLFLSSGAGLQAGARF